MWKHLHKKPIFTIAFIAVLAIGAVSPVYQYYGQPETAEQTVNIAYQTGVDPSKAAQANGDFEQSTGTKINWKKFDSGADVLAAIASGDVAIGNIGSSMLAAAASRRLPVEVFYIADVLGSSEALVVKPSIRHPQDLVGKKIAVPFVSTTHYSLLAALTHWQIAPDAVTIVNLRPPEITAAWQRGYIDAAYVWAPALTTLQTGGRVLVDSTHVGKWGAPTYDLWVARKDFAQKHPDFLVNFVKTANRQVRLYQQSPHSYATSPHIAQIADLTGAQPKDIPLLLAGNHYPDLAEQAEILHQHLAQDIKNTAIFLKQQKKIDAVLNNYSDFVTVQYVRAAQE